MSFAGGRMLRQWRVFPESIAREKLRVGERG
jgi:hypothetical protein